jgi:ABC-type dipeptide/oligopeptide/nickel transport system permease subunit
MASLHDVERARREGVLLGIPLGDLGWFQSLLMGTATGFAAFFASTFVAIFSLLFYRIASGHNPDFTIAYRDVGFPVGVVVMAMALSYFGFQYIRRMKRRAQARQEAKQQA